MPAAPRDRPLGRAVAALRVPLGHWRARRGRDSSVAGAVGPTAVGSATVRAAAVGAATVGAAVRVVVGVRLGRRPAR